MPVRDYRKGQSDEKEPVTRYARASLPERLHQRLADDAMRRAVTQSRLLRAILEQHYAGQPKKPAKAARER